MDKNVILIRWTAPGNNYHQNKQDYCHIAFDRYSNIWKKSRFVGFVAFHIRSKILTLPDVKNPLRKMKKNLSVLVVFWAVLLNLPCFSVAQTSFGKAALINEGWQFKLKDDPDAYKPDYNDKGWRTLDLPHDWSVEAPLSPTLASCTGYLPGGIAWYRKNLYVPADLNGKKVFVYLVLVT